jgi:uncharacterized damage-inducible protein DinB
MYLRFRRLFEYDDEANAKSLTSIRASAPGPSQDRAICILAHILIARKEWLRRLGTDVGGEPAQDFFPKGLSINDLERLLSDVRSLWQGYLSHLTDAKIRQVIDYTSADGKKWSTHVEEVLTHVTLHGAYHRGQIALLVKHGGVDPIATDFIITARSPRD